MGLRERLEWLLRMALLVFILAGAAFLSAITAMRFAIHGREVEMPSLVGKTEAEAQTILAARGLRMKVADRVYSAMPVNAVVRQSPPTGTHMKVTQQAQVLLSLGARKVTVPEVEGRSLRAARIELLRAGLQVGEVSSAHLPEIPADAVVLQDPRPGSGAVSAHVNLLVSQGAREAAYVMPFLLGLNGAEAQRLLTTGGLRAVKVTVVPAPEWPHGTVIEQMPPYGARVAAEAAVELRVAE